MTGLCSSPYTVIPSSAKLTLGMVTWDFYESKGGMGRSMQWFAQALSKDFSVVVGTPGSERPEIGDRDFAVTRFLSLTQRFGGHVLFSFCLPFVLNRWIRKHQIDVLLIPGGPGGVFLIRQPKIPYIVSAFHLYEQQSRLVPGQWWKRLFIPYESRTYRSAKGVLCFNDDTHNSLQKTYHIPVRFLHLLPHAIDSDSWKKIRHSKVKGLCICIARLEKRKGIELLLRAWPDVLHRHPQAKLVIVGRGFLLPAVRRMIQNIPSVRHYTVLSFSDLVSLVQRAEVSVSPSYLEGFGLTLAEAMTAGTAVVAAKSEGIRCLIQDKQTGFLFKSGSEKALADTLIEVLQDDAMRTQIVSQATKEAIVRFDPKAASERLCQTVKEIVTKTH